MPSEVKNFSGTVADVENFQISKGSPYNEDILNGDKQNEYEQYIYSTEYENDDNFELGPADEIEKDNFDVEIDTSFNHTPLKTLFKRTKTPTEQDIRDQHLREQTRKVSRSEAPKERLLLSLSEINNILYGQPRSDDPHGYYTTVTERADNRFELAREGRPQPEPPRVVRTQQQELNQNKQPSFGTRVRNTVNQGREVVDRLRAKSQPISDSPDDIDQDVNLGRNRLQEGIGQAKQVTNKVTTNLQSRTGDAPSGAEFREDWWSPREAEDWSPFKEGLAKAKETIQAGVGKGALKTEKILEKLREKGSDSTPADKGISITPKEAQEIAEDLRARITGTGLELEDIKDDSKETAQSLDDLPVISSVVKPLEQPVKAEHYTNGTTGKNQNGSSQESAQIMSEEERQRSNTRRMEELKARARERAVKLSESNNEQNGSAHSQEEKSIPTQTSEIGKQGSSVKPGASYIESLVLEQKNGGQTQQNGSYQEAPVTFKEYGPETPAYEEHQFANGSSKNGTSVEVTRNTDDTSHKTEEEISPQIAEAETTQEPREQAAESSIAFSQQEIREHSFKELSQHLQDVRKSIIETYTEGNNEPDGKLAHLNETYIELQDIMMERWLEENKELVEIVSKHHHDPALFLQLFHENLMNAHRLQEALHLIRVVQNEMRFVNKTEQTKLTKFVKQFISAIETVEGGTIDSLNDLQNYIGRTKVELDQSNVQYKAFLDHSILENSNSLFTDNTRVIRVERLGFTPNNPLAPKIIPTFTFGPPSRI